MKIMYYLSDRESLTFTAGVVIEIMISYYPHAYLQLQTKSAETR